MDYKVLFDTPYQMDNGQDITVAEIVKAMGHGDVDMELFRSSGAGATYARMMESVMLSADEHAPEVIAYWKARGLIKEFHWEQVPMDWEDYEKRTGYHYQTERAYPQNLTKKWVSFVPASAFAPENAGRKYPAVVVLHGGGNTVYTIDGWGFPNAAAEREWILIVPTLEIDEVIGQILEEAERLYPIDRERVYVAGFSFGSNNTNVLAHSHPEWWAAAAPCGGLMTSGGLGQRMKDLMRRRQQRLKETGAEDVGLQEPDIDYQGPWRSLESGGYMPVITFSGNCDGDIYPIHDSGYLDEVLEGINLWARINDVPEIRRENVLALKGSPTATNAERDIGLPILGGHESNWEKDGIRYHMINYPSRDGIGRLCFVSAENVPHWPTPELSRTLFSFFSHFHRDTKTGEIIYTK